MQINIGLIVGSLRKGAYSRQMANAIKGLAPASFQFTEIGIGELPFYNQDLETESPPAPWVSFRQQVSSCDGIFFVTPEYNRGIPGVLKNAIDVGSRPYAKSVWSGKPSGVLSLTPGALGAMAAHQQLRLTLSILNSPTLPAPELYIPGAGHLFDEAGQLKDPDLRKRIGGYVQGFETWIGRFK